MDDPKVFKSALLFFWFSLAGLPDKEDSSDVQDIIESTPELDMDLIGYKPCRCTTKNLPSDLIFNFFLFFLVLSKHHLSICAPPTAAPLLKASRTWRSTAIQTLCLKSCRLQAPASSGMWMKEPICWVSWGVKVTPSKMGSTKACQVCNFCHCYSGVLGMKNN